MTTLTTTLLLQGQVKAAIITDPVGDFLPTYTGTSGADLDVIGVEVTLKGGKDAAKAV